MNNMNDGYGVADEETPFTSTTLDLAQGAMPVPMARDMGFSSAIEQDSTPFQARREAEYYQDATAALQALAVGWNGPDAEENKQLRARVAGFFGEELAQEMETPGNTDPNNVAGAWMLAMLYTQEGDAGEEDAALRFVRLAEANGESVPDWSNAGLWEVARKKFVDDYNRRKEEAKRLADMRAEAFTEMVKTATADKGATHEWLAELSAVLGGKVTVEDVLTLRDVFKDVRREFAADAVSTQQQEAFYGATGFAPTAPAGAVARTPCKIMAQKSAHVESLFRNRVLEFVSNEDGSVNEQRFALAQAGLAMLAREAQRGSDQGFAQSLRSGFMQMGLDVEGAGVSREDSLSSSEMGVILDAYFLGLVDEKDEGVQRALRQKQAQQNLSNRSTQFGVIDFRTVGQARAKEGLIAAPDEGKLDAALERAADIQRREHSRRRVYGMFRNYTQQVDKPLDDAGMRQEFGALLGTMGAQTSPYFIPYVGTAVGSMTTLATKNEALANQYTYEGLSLEAAKNRASADALGATLVEMLPGSALGGWGANTILRWMTRGAKPGAATRAAAAWSARGPLHAAVLEGGVGFMEEAAVEPFMQGVWTMGADAVMDWAGMPHGESRTFGEAMNELKETWTNPEQLVAIALFTGGLTGAHMPQIAQQSEEFDAWMAANLVNGDLPQALGMTQAQRAQLFYEEDEAKRVKLAKEFMRENLSPDAAPNTRARMRQFAAEKLEGGQALKLAGMDKSAPHEARRTLGEAWRMEVERGRLPMVEEMAQRGGVDYFRITDHDAEGKEVVYEKPAAEADMYIALRLQDIVQEQMDDARQLILRGMPVQTSYTRLQDNLKSLLGQSLLSQVETRGEEQGISTLNLNEVKEEGIGERIAAQGMAEQADLQDLQDYVGGVFSGLTESWADRQRIEQSTRGQQGVGTAIFTAPSGRSYMRDNRTLAGQLLAYSRGNVFAEEVHEDVSEAFFKQRVLSPRVQEKMDAGLSQEVAVARTTAELAEMMREFRELLVKRDAGAKTLIPEVPSNAKISDVVEAFSHIQRARALASSMPAWAQEVQQLSMEALGMSADLITLANAAREVEKEVGENPLVSIFHEMDIATRDMFAAATMGEAEINAVRHARVLRDSLGSYTGARSVEEAEELQAEEEAEIQAEEERRLQSTPPAPEPAKVRADAEEQVQRMARNCPQAVAPDSMAGVFVNGQAYLNEAADCWVGMIDPMKLELSDEVQQVKAGRKDARGVINRLVGAYQPTAGALHVWRRRNGRLEVISGRHRLALAQDQRVPAVNCMVYDESEVHNARWARLLDFEENMRDDQADELTAAIYTRETGYCDAKLAELGLLRNASRSKRGIFIGREAREELYTRFKNGVVNAMDAEKICLMTEGIRDKARVDEIQRRACMLLEQSKSWEYINAMVQLMANKESVFMKQGLLDFGADFEADLERAAKYIEKNLQLLNEAISVLKAGRKLSGKKKELANRLGSFTTSAEDSAQTLDDLLAMRERFNNIGSYPELVNDAQLWDGKTEPDPVGKALEMGESDAAREAAERSMSIEELTEARLRRQEQEAGMSELFGASLSMRSVFDEKGKRLHHRYSPIPATLITSADEAKAILDKARKGQAPKSKGYRNRASGVRARVVQETLGKTNSAGVSIKNLTRAGVKNDTLARQIHYTACAHIPELFESAEYWVREKNYDKEKKKGRLGAIHFFNLISIKDVGEFSVNITVLVPQAKHEGQRFFAMEVTIENPISAGQATLHQTGLSINANGAYEARVAAFQTFVEKEILEIEKQARNEGCFLLAPNGEKTNLTKEQWLMVRTKAFKDWFGDWENDPENASKMLDLNGEPIVAYHGTYQDFLAFRTDAPHANDAGYYGQGIYFAFYRSEYFTPQAARSEAAYYGPRVLGVFLNIRNPFNFGALQEHKGNSSFNMMAERYVFPYNLAKQFPELEGKVEMPGGMSFKEYIDQVEEIERSLVVEDVMDSDGRIYHTIGYWEGAYGYYKDAQGNTHKYKKTQTIRHRVEPEQLEHAKINAIFEAVQEVFGLYYRDSAESIMMKHPEITDIIKARGHDGILQSEYGDEAVIFEPEQVKSATDNRGTFDPQNPNITLSVRSHAQWAMTALAPRIEELEGQRVLKRLDFWLKQIDAVQGEQDAEKGSGSARFAQLIGMIEATRNLLPPNEPGLGRLNVTIKWASIMAGLIEDGQLRDVNGLLKGGMAQKFTEEVKRRYEAALLKGLSEEEAREVLAKFGSDRLDRMMKRAAKTCREAIDTYLKKLLRLRVAAIAERAYPKRERGKKSKKGKMESTHYLQMQEILRWMNSDVEAVSKKLDELRVGIAQAERKGDEAGRIEAESLREEMHMVDLFGCWEDMTLQKAQRATQEFADFVANSREGWTQKLERDKARMEYTKHAIRQNFVKAFDANTRAKVQSNGRFATLKNAIKGGFYSVMNYAQLMKSAEKVLGSAFVGQKLDEIAAASAGLLNSGNEMREAFYDCARLAFGADSETEVNKALNEFAEVQERTGIKKRELVRSTVRMKREEAERWVNMTREEREEERRDIRARDEQRGERTPNVPTEEQVKLMRQLLDERAASPKKNVRDAKNIVVETQERAEEVEMLNISRDAVANILLHLEQEDYRHIIEDEGFIPRDAAGNALETVQDPALDLEQTLKPLYDFIGEKGRRFVYGLREFVRRNGELMQVVYESRMGVPLQMKENYWRGNFDTVRINEKEPMPGENGAASDGGGGYGFLIERVKHHLKLNWANTATNAFLRIVEAQNNYIHTSHITTEWRSLLADHDFALRLRNELGLPFMAALGEWLSVIDGTQVMAGKQHRWGNKLFRGVRKGIAVAALGGNGWVLAKQSSAILHGYMAGYVPRIRIETENGIRELENRHIGVGEFGVAFARANTGNGSVSFKEILESDFFKARFDAKHRRVAERMSMAQGEVNYARMAAVSDLGMSAIEWTDRTANLLGMAALADAVYNAMKKSSAAVGATLTHERLVEESLKAVGRALELAAQPKSRLQKSLGQAQGGILQGMFLLFKSEAINKLGFAAARAMAGEGWGAAGGFIAYGCFNAMVATAINWIRYGDEDKKKKEWYEHAALFAYNALTSEFSAVPGLGDLVGRGQAAIEGRYYISKGPAGIVDPVDMWKRAEHLVTGRKGYKGRKRMSAEDYIADTCALIRPVATVTSGFAGNSWLAELILTAATLGNVTRGAGDIIQFSVRCGE